MAKYFFLVRQFGEEKTMSFERVENYFRCGT